MKLYSKIENGQFALGTMSKILTALRQYEGKVVEITLSKPKSKRSAAQNAMWWSWMTLLQNETGVQKEDLHDSFKSKFLSVTMQDPISGEDYQKIRSTIELNKTEFTEMSNKLIAYCSETLNIILPTPDENWELQFN